MKSEEYKWPPKCHLNFRDGRGRLYFDSTDRDLDLFDNLMLYSETISRTVYFGLSASSSKYTVWNESTVEKIEWLIRYDLNFDGQSVSIKRISKLGASCSDEFIWKLFIRPMDHYSKPKEEKIEGLSRTHFPKRYRKARADASIDSIQKTVAEKFGLPLGCVKLVNPNGRKIQPDATVGALVSNWRNAS